MVYYDTGSDTLQDTDTHAHARNDDVREPLWFNSCIREDGLVSREHLHALTHGRACSTCGAFGFTSI